MLQTGVIYKVVCRTTGRIYVGLSVNPVGRFKQHMSKPPRRMALDLEEHGRSEFYIQTLCGCRNKAEERQMEAFHIEKYEARGPRGYNDLEGDPTISKRFWAIHRSRSSATRWINHEFFLLEYDCILNTIFFWLWRVVACRLTLSMFALWVSTPQHFFLGSLPAQAMPFPLSYLAHFGIASALQ